MTAEERLTQSKKYISEIFRKYEQGLLFSGNMLIESIISNYVTLD
jgi:hypothetical protein